MKCEKCKKTIEAGGDCYDSIDLNDEHPLCEKCATPEPKAATEKKPRKKSASRFFLVDLSVLKAGYGSAATRKACREIADKITPREGDAPAQVAIVCLHEAFEVTLQIRNERKPIKL